MYLNLPNLLTVMRIAVIPLFICLFYNPTPERAFWAGVFFVAAALTDLLDGYLARKWGEVTVIGKLLDPVADKLLVLTALIILLDLNQVSSIAVILVISREIFVTGLRSIASANGIIIPADTLGKYKLVMQIFAISFLIFKFSIEFIPYLHEAGIAVLWISIIVGIVSAVQYLVRLITRLEERIN